MSLITDIFGKQDIGQVLGEVAGAVLNGGHATGTGVAPGSGSGTSGFGGIPLNVGLDTKSISKILLWVGAGVVGVVLLIFALKRNK